MTTIQTQSGYFDIFNPYKYPIKIEDIAHGLAFTCRFRGFTSRYYSVAQHSYNVSVLLEAWGYPIRVQLAGLLHDASEAYMGDMPTPHKEQFAEFTDIEKHLQNVIFARFGLERHNRFPVHDADHLMLHEEAKVLLPTPTWAKEQPEARPDVVDLSSWGCEMARRIFLIRYEGLVNGTH